jgi:hypothetical protein
MINFPRKLDCGNITTILQTCQVFKENKIMSDLFNTSEVINISGLTRNNLEYYRRENILYAVSDKPLRWDYKNLFFCLVINELRKLEPRNTALRISSTILKSNLDCIENKIKLLIFANYENHSKCIKLKEIPGFLKLENENNEFLKYYTTPYDFKVKDEIFDIEVQFTISEYYVLDINLAKEHLNKLCIDNDCEHKIPSFAFD